MLTNPPILNSVLNMKALVGAFNQEKALVGAYSVIVQLHRLIDLRHYKECYLAFIDFSDCLNTKICIEVLTNFFRIWEAG